MILLYDLESIEFFWIKMIFNDTFFILQGKVLFQKKIEAFVSFFQINQNFNDFN